MILDSIITEWRFRLPHGYPTTSQDYDILRDVLLELTSITESEASHIVRRAMGIYDDAVNEDIFTTEQETSNEKYTLTESSSDYDSAIRERLGLQPDAEIPQVTGNYNLDAGPIALNSNDAAIFKKLWPETMNSAIIGKGEIALYWLYQYQNPSVNTIDNRGDDQPDLTIDNDNAEVKSYPSHNARIGLGRFQKFKETRQLVSIIFGIHTLAKTFNPKDSTKVYSDLAFGGKELTDAFQTFKSVDSLPAKAQLIEMFPIFKTLFSQIELVKQSLNLRDDTYDPKAAAAALLTNILREKLQIKPGDGGYIINTSSKNPADIYVYQIDFESLDVDTVLANVAINGGVIEANYKNLFASKG
jgi:hypothetical protein